MVFISKYPEIKINNIQPGDIIRYDAFSDNRRKNSFHKDRPFAVINIAYDETTFEPISFDLIPLTHTIAHDKSSEFSDFNENLEDIDPEMNETLKELDGSGKSQWLRMADPVSISAESMRKSNQRFEKMANFNEFGRDCFVKYTYDYLIQLDTAYNDYKNHKDEFGYTPPKVNNVPINKFTMDKYLISDTNIEPNRYQVTQYENGHPKDPLEPAGIARKRPRKSGPDFDPFDL